MDRLGSSLRVVCAGVIETDPAEALDIRLAQLFSELSGLMEELAPSEVALERVLFQMNARTAMSVGQAAGIALVCAARAKVPVSTYSANEIKLAVAGWGGAGKREVQRMVQILLDLDELPRPPDVADALALAICHAQGAAARDRERAAGVIS